VADELASSIELGMRPRTRTIVPASPAGIRQVCSG